MFNVKIPLFAGFLFLTPGDFVQSRVHLNHILKGRCRIPLIFNKRKSGKATQISLALNHLLNYVVNTQKLLDLKIGIKNPFPNDQIR